MLKSILILAVNDIMAVLAMSTPAGLTIEEIITSILTQPQAIAVIAIQFFLGLALGYVSIKALKYILAFIAILVLGTFLSVWSLGTSPTEVLTQLGLAAEAIKKFAAILGLMTVGPVSIGFIIGAILGLIRK